MKQGWEIKRLDDIIESNVIGITKNSSEQDTHHKFKYVKMNNITRDNRFDLTKYTCVNATKLEAEKYSLSDGDFLFNTRNSYELVGKTCLFEGSNNEVVLYNNNIMRIRFIKKINPFFINYAFSTEDLIKKINLLKSGTTNVSAIYYKDLKNLELSVPPLPEQQRIVSLLDEAFAVIAKARANAEQNLKNAKELFDVYLHKYYSSKEDGWEEKKLKEVADYFNGLTYSPKNVSNKGIIVLRSSNVQNDELDFKDIVRVNLSVKEKIIVKEGDILMCSRNGSARLVGKTATIKNLDEEMTFGTFMMIVRSEYNKYLSWFFKSTNFRNQIKGGGNTMINQITRYMLDDIVLSFPPIEKQNEVVRQLDDLSVEIKKLETIYFKKINDLEELKKSVLQKAFSGELKTEKILV